MLKILLVVLLVAVVIYGVTRLVERRGITRPTLRRQPPRMVAPDDDPDFLWDLDRRKRHPGPRSNPQADPSPPDDDEPDLP